MTVKTGQLWNGLYEYHYIVETKWIKDLNTLLKTVSKPIVLRGLERSLDFLITGTPSAHFQKGKQELDRQISRQQENWPIVKRIISGTPSAHFQEGKQELNRQIIR